MIDFARNGSRRALFALLVPLALGACDEPSGPEQGYTIRRQSGDGQFAGFGQLLEEPLRVIVEDANTGNPAAGIVVEWTILSGAGAELGVTRANTDANGVASTTLRLGHHDTDYRVRAAPPHRVGSAVTFDARAVAPTTVDSVSPATADAGDTIRVFGRGFIPNTNDNTVLIAGFRATVLDATATELRVVVPACVPTRTADLRVDLGTVTGSPVALAVTGTDEPPLSMSVGQVIHRAGSAETACLRLGANAGARYLLLLQNAAEIAGRDLGYRVSAASAAGLLASREARLAAHFAPGAHSASAASRMEARGPQSRLDAALREAERRTLEAWSGAARASLPAVAGAPTSVEIGDRRDFWVFRSSGDYERVTAEVRHVSDHAILYQDLDAPTGGFSAQNFQEFGAVFDDPIYETMVDVYGETSDVDGNGRVIILFTPVVNRMTPPGSSTSFVAGFFFGIDLLDDQARGNEAEIFYTLVPDPTGEFGNVRTFEQILRGVPPVMAHEFQHMIHFNQRVLLRDASLEATWLSEGLAHAAEELVGDVYVARGEDQRGFDFRIQNFLRASVYLEDPAAVSLLGPAVPLPVRGASWLLLEYLQGHFGGDDLLGALTNATVSSTANITTQTGLSWGTVLSRWGIALWADDAGIAGLDPLYTFPDLNLRAVFHNTAFPLQPAALPWADFSHAARLPAAGSSYWLVDGGAAAEALNLAVAGRYAPFGTADRPQLTILRIE